MFKNGPKPKNRFEKAIDELLLEMKSQPAHSDEYAAMADQIVKLHALQEKETPERISKDTLASIAGNLTAVAIIISYERTHVMASKALQFVTRI